VAKLSDAVLDEGRALLRAGDLDAFEAWVKKHAPTLDEETVMATMNKMVGKFDRSDVAIRLFDEFFENYDAYDDVNQAGKRACCLVFVAAGALGGVVYLLRALWGLW